jgi:hypothetical protein
MGITSFPGGIFAPNVMGGALPGKVFWVGNRSDLPAGNGTDAFHPLPTINTALAKCTSGAGDVVYVLPGHAENISAADAWSSLVAGTQIIGLGTANARPTFTWTATGGTILANVANVRIQNCRFLMAGPLASTTALTVTVGIPVTAAGFQFVGNEVNVGVDADQLCTDAFTLDAASDDCLFEDNRIWGGILAEITSVITTSAAGVDRLTIKNNRISASVVTAATGVLLDLDAGALVDNDIIGNILHNSTASAKYVIDPHATSTGLVDGNRWLTGDGGTTPATSAFATYTTTYKFGLNYCATAVAVSAIISPANDA